MTDLDLWKAAQSAHEGLVDADLGGGVIKQRIARPGQGKSGGFRSILLFRKAHRAVYVYGFEKKSRENIGPDELEAFRELAVVVLGYSDSEMEELVTGGALLRVSAPDEEDDEQKTEK